MIPVVAIGSLFLSVFEDGSETDLEDLFQRAVLLNKPMLLIDRLQDDSNHDRDLRSFFSNLWDWMLAGEGYDRFVRRQIFELFYDAERTSVHHLVQTLSSHRPIFFQNGETYVSQSLTYHNARELLFELNLRYDLWSAKESVWLKPDASFRDRSESAPHLYQLLRWAIAERGISRYDDAIRIETNPKMVEVTRRGTVQFIGKEEDQVSVVLRFWMGNDEDAGQSQPERRERVKDSFDVPSTPEGFDEAMRRIDKAESDLLEKWKARASS